MNAAIDHMTINVGDVTFYKGLLTHLGFKTIMNYAYGFGASDGNASIWVFKTSHAYSSNVFHRKATGLNHVAFRVGTKADVDDFYKQYMIPHGIPALYGGPAEHPEYVPGYYAVYFEDPDRIKLEVMFAPV